MTYEGNPFVDMAEIEAAKKTLPDAIFRAEYLGEFIEGESMVFQNYKNCMFDQWPRSQGRIYVGCDLARESDFTCAVFMDEKGNVIDIYRENQKDWSYMIDEIVKRARTFQAQIMVETNSMGTVVLEQMRKQYNKVEGFTTTNKSKQEIIEGLILDFHEGNISIPGPELFEPLQNELDVFEMKYSPKSRSVIYAAREPFHDDLVMALAISNYNRKQDRGTYAVQGGSRRF